MTYTFAHQCIHYSIVSSYIWSHILHNAVTYTLTSTHLNRLTHTHTHTHFYSHSPSHSFSHYVCYCEPFVILYLVRTKVAMLPFFFTWALRCKKITLQKLHFVAFSCRLLIVDTRDHDLCNFILRMYHKCTFYLNKSTAWDLISPLSADLI